MLSLSTLGDLIGTVEADLNVPERNRNDGKVITLDEDVHMIMSKKCPNDPVKYNLDYAICQQDGSVWVRIAVLDEIHKKDNVEP